MAANHDTGSAVRWRYWPLTARPAISAVGVVVILAAAAAAYYISENAVVAAICLLALAASLQSHFLPRRYALDDAGVAVVALGIKKVRPWEYFHSYYGDRRGIMLSTFSYASRLDAYRGVNLRFGEADRERVAAFVAGKLPYAAKKKRRGEEESRPEPE
jgi:hypothetical protein